MSIEEIRGASAAALLHAPYRSAGERVLQADNHPKLRPYHLCGGTASDAMANSVAATINAVPRLLNAVEAVLELCEIAETNVDGSKRRNPNTIHPDAIRHMLDSALEAS